MCVHIHRCVCICVCVFVYVYVYVHILSCKSADLYRQMRINFKPNVNHFYQIIHYACEPIKVILRIMSVNCFII